MRVFAILVAALGAGCASAAQSGAPRTVIVQPGMSIDSALAASGTGPVHLRLAPGRHVLEPRAFTDASCGNCEDASETVPATVGLRIAGRGITIEGAHRDSVTIVTHAGYGLLFEDCTDCALRGVTVTGGTRDADGRATSAGIVARRSSVLVESCAVRDNIGDSATVARTIVGIAGIAGREQSRLEIRDCDIIRNSWDGIALYRGAYARIANNVVDGVDRAAGARVGGGRGVGIGLTWDARAQISGNLVRRYWKGIGAFVEADADISGNIVEDILTWGIALWGPDGATPAARIRRNVVYRTGACGVMIDRRDGDDMPGELTGNIIAYTGTNARYDTGEPYCWQRAIAQPNVPQRFVIADNAVYGAREPEAANVPAPAAHASLAQLVTAAAALERMSERDALRGAAFFRDVAAAVPAADWERILAAEDARAATPQDVRVLKDASAASHAGVRAMAVRAMGRTEQRQFLPDVMARLDDADARVRVVAAHAIGNILRDSANGASRDRLLGMLNAADAETAPAVAETLGRLRHDADAARVVASGITPLLASNGTRLGALRGLYFLARQPAARTHVRALARDALTDAARSAAPRERVLAIATLVATAAADGALLRAAIADPDWTVRREAAAGTLALQDTAAADAILDGALRDPAAPVRYEAVRVYARRSAQSRGCAPVLRAARDSTLHVAQLAITQLAGPCRGADAVALLDSIAATLTGTQWHRAASATLALAALGTSSAGAHTARLASHTSPFARAWAARAAGALRDAARLRNLAEDPHHNVRFAAVDALRTVAGHAADDVYVAQLSQTDSELLQAATQGLEGSTTRGVGTALLDALDRVTALKSETSRDARVALLARVQELATPADSARLRAYLRDFDPIIARRAAAILEDWTGRAVQPAPQPLPRLALPTHADAEQLERSRFIIELENGAEITLALLPFDAPTNAWRLARLARSGWFDGLTLHRVVPNFVVQGGSPGANEYSGDAMFTNDELGVPNWRGTVGLSTRGRDTGDGQFYINLVDNVRLDHEYTVFGIVTAGMEHVDAAGEGVVIRRVREIR